MTEDEVDKILEDYLKSEEFFMNMEKAIIASTWDIGLPRVYSRDGWLIKEWKDGTKHKIKL